MSDTITVFDLISALRLFVNNEHEIQTPVTIGDITVIKENGSIRVGKTVGVVTEAELLALGFEGVGLVGSIITGDPTVKANVREVVEQFGIKPEIPFDVVDNYFNNQNSVREKKGEQKNGLYRFLVYDLRVRLDGGWLGCHSIRKDLARWARLPQG